MHRCHAFTPVRPEYVRQDARGCCSRPPQACRYVGAAASAAVSSAGSATYSWIMRLRNLRKVSQSSAERIKPSFSARSRFSNIVAGVSAIARRNAGSSLSPTVSCSRPKRATKASTLSANSSSSGNDRIRSSLSGTAKSRVSQPGIVQFRSGDFQQRTKPDDFRRWKSVVHSTTPVRKAIS